MEKIGIEHVGKELRHGRPLNAFTIWFGSNLTIADFALGSLFFGLPLSSIISALVIGNILGGLLLGLMSSMGPTFGYPQMMISRAVIGRIGNLPFALANWLSTVGWFTVNIILGGYALQLAFHMPFFEAAGIVVLADVVLALYGHDVIHIFERAMSVVLGIMFAFLTWIAVSQVGSNLMLYNSRASFDPYFWALVVAGIFSYLMSWSPYASDYTRYLPIDTPKWKIALYTMAGGAIASAWTELAGFFVYVAANNTKLNAIGALAIVSGSYSLLSLLTVVLGALAADALNLYTNSLSALVLFNRAGRIRSILAAGILGYILSLAGSSNFGAFYSSFLLILDYWITPWIAVMLAAFYIKKVRSGVENPPEFIKSGIFSYLTGLIISIPFMNLQSYGINFVGPIAIMLAGADISYFVAFLAAFVSYFIFYRLDKNFKL